MVIDTSAILTILLQEPEAHSVAKAIATDTTRLMSASILLESSMVLLTRFGDEGIRDLDLLVAKYKIEIAPVTETQITIARRAFKKFGKGRHPAGLNFGDCFSYALSKETKEPLICKGNDFSQTDLALVSYL